MGWSGERARELLLVGPTKGAKELSLLRAHRGGGLLMSVLLRRLSKSTPPTFSGRTHMLIPTLLRRLLKGL